MKPSTSLMMGMAPSLIRRASSSADPAFALAWRMAAYMRPSFRLHNPGLRLRPAPDRTPLRDTDPCRRPPRLSPVRASHQDRDALPAGPGFGYAAITPAIAPLPDN